MLDNETLTKKVAAFKKESRKDFDKAVAALIALAFLHKDMGADFLWDKDPALDAEANRICRELSDTLTEKAKDLARDAVKELDDYDIEEFWDVARDEWFVPITTRFDQQGSFLKELLEIWVALAFVYGLSQGELRVEISRFLANPFLSPLWRGLPMDILKWGRGYSKNIAEQIAVIGQNAILSAVRLAEWQNAKDNGATYYIRRRGSGYDCPDCDDLCGYPIPIDEPFEFLHSRCMCWAEYHDGEIPTSQ